MIEFNLPKETIVQRIIPKNSFDSYTNSKEKNLFSKNISKIIWLNKLSGDTTNLPSSLIQEIQIFKIELKEMCDIGALLKIIDKSIPYTIIFIITTEDNCKLQTSPKHSSLINDRASIIDWTYQSSWFKSNENSYKLDLSKSIDYVYFQFCSQFSNISSLKAHNVKELIDLEQKFSSLEKSITRLTNEMNRTLQFNKRIELKLKIQELESKIEKLM